MENSIKHSDRKKSSSTPKNFFDAPVAFPAKHLSPAADIHIEHLKNQYEHPLVLYEYHIQHMNIAKNRQLFEQHRGLADTMAKAIAPYEALLLNSGAEPE